jgi:hypothetical protein
MTTDIQSTREPTTRRAPVAVGRGPRRAALVALGVALLVAAAIAAAVVAGGEPAVTQPRPVVAPAEDTAGGDDRSAGFDHEHQSLRDRVGADSAADRELQLDREVQRFRNAVEGRR